MAGNANSRHKIVMKTPAELKRWKDAVADADREKPELIRWAKRVMAEKRALLLQVTELLQAAREARGLTLEQLQEITGTHKGQLSKLLSADGNPTLYTLHRVADALGKRLVVTLTEK